MLDTQHAESWNWVQEWESRVPLEPLVPEPERMPPRFTVQLPQLPDATEGDPIQVNHLFRLSDQTMDSVISAFCTC